MRGCCSAGGFNARRGDGEQTLHLQILQKQQEAERQVGVDDAPAEDALGHTSCSFWVFLEVERVSPGLVRPTRRSLHLLHLLLAALAH